MKSLVSLVGKCSLALLAMLVVSLCSTTAFAQRGQCNVQQAPQVQTSAAAAIERAQITSALQAQPVIVQARPGALTSATATASSGPSVAALRAAAVPVVVQAVPVQTQQFVQSVPVIPSDQNVVLLASNNSSSKVGLLDRLAARRNTSVSKSVAITRTSSR